MFIGPEAFTEIVARDPAKDLFRRSVERVEVETHSYCNRRCPYCPNRDGSRLGENVRIDDRLFALVLENLAEIEFASVLVLSDYDEPLADRFILERIRAARAALPGAEIALYSNGDYLTPDYLRELVEAGLTSLTLSVHLKEGETFAEKTAVERLNDLGKRAGLRFKGTLRQAGRYLIGEARAGSLRVEARAVDHFALGTRRGNLVPEVRQPPPRTDPCNFPFAHFTMGYSGNIVPCCHIVSDAPAHEHLRIGNLADFDSIYQAYASEKAAAWRRALIGYGEKAEPCRSCSVPFPRLAAADRDKLVRAAERLGIPATP